MSESGVAGHTQEDVVAAHGNLRRRGSEYVGPCPSCGGTDRFYVRPSGRFFCRQCCRDGRDVEKFKEIAGLLGLRPKAGDWSDPEFHIKRLRRLAEKRRSEYFELESTADIMAARLDDPDAPWNQPPDEEVMAEEAEARREEAMNEARDLALGGDPEAALELLDELIAADAEVDIELGITKAGSIAQLRDAIETARDEAEAYSIDPMDYDIPDPPDRIIEVRIKEGNNWRIFPAARRNEVTVIGGAGSSGKSFLTLGIAAAMGRGDEKHAHFSVSGKHTTVWSSEGGFETAIRRLHQLGLNGGVNVVRRLRPLVEQEGDKIVPTKWYFKLLEDAKRNCSDLIIIDPGMAAFDIAKDDGRAIRACLQLMERLAREASAAVVVVTHSTKHARYNARDLMKMSPDEIAATALRGSGEWYDTPRNALFVFGRGKVSRNKIILSIKHNDSQSGWAVEVEPTVRKVFGQPDEFSGWSGYERFLPGELAERYGDGGDDDDEPEQGRRTCAHDLGDGRGMCQRTAVKGSDYCPSHQPSPEPTEAEHRLQQARGDIVACLRHPGTPKWDNGLFVTAENLHRIVGGDDAVRKEALADMIADDTVKADGLGTDRNPVRYVMRVDFLGGNLLEDAGS